MRNTLIVFVFLCYFAVQGQVSVTKDGYAKIKKKPIETSLIDSDSINVSKSDGILRSISFGDFKNLLPFSNSSGIDPVTQAEYELLTPTEIAENDYAIVDESTGSVGGGIQSVVAGSNISVDNTDPDNPIINVVDIADRDSGTTGIVLRGNTSGVHTVGSQSWYWEKSGRIILFEVTLGGGISGSSTGDLVVDLSGTTIPTMLGGSDIFNVITNNLSINYYSISAYHSDLDNLRFRIQDGLDGSNNEIITDADLTGTQAIVISGTYRIN